MSLLHIESTVVSYSISWTTFGYDFTSKDSFKTMLSYCFGLANRIFLSNKSSDC